MIDSLAKRDVKAPAPMLRSLDAPIAVVLPAKSKVTPVPVTKVSPV